MCSIFNRWLKGLGAVQMLDHELHERDARFFEVTQAVKRLKRS